MNNILNELIESQETFDKDYPTISIEDAKQVALEFAKHILEEAAENGSVKERYPNPYDGNWVEYVIDKKSITDTINKYL